MHEHLLKYPKKYREMENAIRRFSIDFFEKAGFTYGSTPVLSPPSGEPYNDTISLTVNGIPAELADSPQVYKMMLIMAGFPDYYQFAHCFRAVGEAERGTRLTEFTQIDVEAGNIDFETLCERALSFTTSLATHCGLSSRVETMDGLSCRDTYGADMKPEPPHGKDEWSIVLIKRLPLTNSKGDHLGASVPCHHIFARPSVPVPEGPTTDLSQVTTESFDIVVNGVEIGGGDLRITDAALQRRMMNLFGVKSESYADYLTLLNAEGNRLGGGFAFGLERLVMVLSGAAELSDVVPFPDYYTNRRW